MRAGFFRGTIVSLRVDICLMPKHRPVMEKRRRRSPTQHAGLFAAILGQSETDNLNLAEAIRSGLEPKLWTELRRIYTSPELASVIGVSEKTLLRKQSSRGRMGIVEGDRTVRLAQITRDAATAFGDLDKAMRWMRKPNRILAGHRPIDLITTEPGAALVRKALGTVEYGGVV